MGTLIRTGAILLLVELACATTAGAMTRCIYAETPPAPPPKGAVLWVPPTGGSTKPNTVVLEFKYYSDRVFDCAKPIVQHPRVISVADADGPLFFFGEDGSVFQWGAVNVGLGDAAPSFPDGLVIAGTEDPSWVARFGWGCRGCNLSGQTLDLPSLVDNSFNWGNFSHANLQGAILNGDGRRHIFTGANLDGATFNSERLDGARFDGHARIRNVVFNVVVFDTVDFSDADLTDASFPTASILNSRFDRAILDGARFTSPEGMATTSLDHASVNGTVFGTPLYDNYFNALQFRTPPSFANAQLSHCTCITRTDLLEVSFSGVSYFSPEPWYQCEVCGIAGNGPPFEGSRISVGVMQAISAAALPSVLAGKNPPLDWAGVQFFASSFDRKALAGADLHGVNLSGASFLGEALDLTGTVFDGANLAKTNFGQARLSGASFANVTAPGASFLGADLAADGAHPAANFSGANTNLAGANFVNANLAGAKFVGAELGGASFSGARAEGTDFSGVRAPGAIFAGAHVYGDGQAFNNATDLQGADFTGAVLASDVNQGGGFDFTGAALNGAHFDNVVCVACNFTNATLTATNFTGAYLPGAVLSGASLAGASFDRAWFYCGDPSNGACTGLAGSPPRWSWPLALSSDEVYGPVPFAQADLAGVSFGDVDTCPDGKSGTITPAGCEGHLLPDPANAPAIPAPCSASAGGACPTPTSTLNDSASIGTPLAVVPRAPPTWNTFLPGEGYLVAFDDGTIRLIGLGKPPIIAGAPGRHCPAATDSCGDGGQATAALLGTPSGLAVGLDGSLYIADPALHRLRRIDPSGTISTVAGSGAACAAGSSCGDGGPATAATFAGPNGVWVDTRGVILIADGARGVRRLSNDGTVSTLTPGSGSIAVMAVVGNADGVIFATTRQPDALIRIDPATGKATTVVGTGTSGYNGNTDALGNLFPGTQVQVNGPVGLALENDGKVLFADTGNHLIRAYVPATGHVIDDLAGKVANGVPLVGFNGDGHWANDTLLHSPLGVAATRGALIVVADSANQRVRQFGPVPVSATVSAARPTALLTCGTRPIQSCRRIPLTPQALRAKRAGAVTISDEGSVLATGWRLESDDAQVRFLVTEQRPLLRDRYHFAIRWAKEPRSRQIRVR